MAKTIDPAKTQQKERLIGITPLNCNGCLRCQMACSLSFYGLFSPELADIVVRRDPGLPYRYHVGFTKECRDGCHLCVRYCPYECLVNKRGAEA